jgi:hypothetical protein
MKQSLLLAILSTLVVGCQGMQGLQGAPGPQGPAGSSPSTPITPAADSAYVGCYTDQNTRALPAFLMTSGATVETCIAAAKAAGYAFAGVQYGVQCFAGNDVGYTVDVQSACNMPCSANPSETCGGTWHNSVYFTGVNPQ